MTILEEAKFEGKVEGRVEGKAETLDMLLAQRFGALFEAHRAQVRAATLEQLDGWLRDVLEADSVEAVLENGANGAHESDGSNGHNDTGGSAR